MKTKVTFFRAGSGILLMAAAVFWMAWNPAAVPPNPATAVVSRPDSEVRDTVPAAAWPSIREQIAAEQRAFRPAPDGALHSFNPTGGERLILEPDGTASVRLRGDESLPAKPAPGDHLAETAILTPEEIRPAATLKLKAETLGRSGNTAGLSGKAGPAVVEKHGTERHLLTDSGGSVVEWWKSGARGFEVGWTLAERPPGQGVLKLDLALDCPWPAETSGDGQRVHFRDPADSGWQFVCDGLVATDATGRRLTAHLATTTGRLSISVDDAGAAYPVVIDPWLYSDRVITAKASDSTAGRRFGSRVAGCGDVLVVGSQEPGNTGDYDGEVYIMSRQGNNFAQRRKVSNVALPATSVHQGGPAFAVSGDTVAVGPVQGVQSSRVIVYERNAGGASVFGQVAEVQTGTDPYHKPRLSGDFMTIPYIAESAGGTAAAGVLRVFRKDAGGPSAWGLVATLDAGDLKLVDGIFGISAEIDNNTLTAFGRAGINSMACFVFRKGNEEGTQWVRTKVIPLPGLPISSLNARLLGNVLAVGAPGSTTEGIRIFDRNAGGAENWGLARTIAIPAGAQQFGYSMALLGGLLAVGSPVEDVDHDNDNSTPDISNAGALRLFARDAGGVDAWGLVQTFTDGIGAEQDGRYGEGVAFAGDRLLIGRPKGDSSLPTVADAGVVIAVGLSSGQWRADTLSAHTQNVTGWGSAIAVSGPYVLVGAPRFDGPAGVDAGWAFLFRDGVLVTSLLPTSQQAGEQFGYSVAMQGDRLVVGSPFRSGTINAMNYSDLGAVTIFERNIGGADNWGVRKSFSQPSINAPSASPEFGTSVALEGDVLAVGAPAETSLSLPGASVKGRTKIFYRNTGGIDNWGLVKSFQGEDNGLEERFGTSVSLSGDTLLTGAPWEEVNGIIRSGAVYVHRRNQGGADNWGRTAKLTQPVVKGDSWFGHSVSLDGDVAVIGTPHEDRNAEPNVGAAYFFEGGQSLQDTWTFLHRWQPEEWETGAEGGYSVGLSHGLAIIGIPTNIGPSGRVEVLARQAGGNDAWGVVWEGEGQESYGTAVGIDGFHFAFGEPLADTTVNNIPQTDRGNAYAYHFLAGEFQAVATRSGGTGAARMGTSVALHGDWLVVGAPEEDINADADAGAAYVFHRNRPASGAWGLTQRLVDGLDNAAATRFGAALALDDQWLMIGVPGSHRVQTFYRQDQATPQGLPWVDSVSLSAGGQPNALGTSLAMENGILIAGAPLQDVSGNVDSGAAYLFERNMVAVNAWGLKTPLSPQDPGAGDAFGSSMALSGGRVAIGAPLDNNAEGADAGAVYLFERNQGGVDDWGQLLKITHASQDAGDEMGRSVALKDGLLLTGLPKSDGGAGADTGRAILFARNTGGANAWGWLKSFSPPDGTVQGRFGSAVAVDAEHAVIGAPFADPRNLANAGAAYVYSREWTGDEAWALLQTLAPTDCTAGAEFGAALALDGSTLAFGAPGDGVTGKVHLHLLRGRAFYDEWATAHSLEGEWALPTADADGDGQANLIEMVLGSHPRDGSQLGRITLVPSGDHLIVSAWKNEPCAVPVGFAAETSVNLQTWAPATPAQILVDDESQLRIQLSISGPRQFVRWRATLP